MKTASPTSSTEELDGSQVHACLSRIGLGREWASCPRNLDSLSQLQLKFMQSVPFENLDVFAGRPLRTDVGWSFDKIVTAGRGGWCFEVNGLFGSLLSAVGFEVLNLGAAVLLEGPANLIDHLALEVMLDEPYLVDVGFGDGAPITPMPISRGGLHDGVVGQFELIPSPQGTTLAELVDGAPAARYRFKRVAHGLDEFARASQRLAGDSSSHWHKGPFATRVIDSAGTRLTLTRKGLTTHGSAPRRTEPIPAESSFDDLLAEHFGIREKPL